VSWRFERSLAALEIASWEQFDVSWEIEREDLLWKHAAGSHQGHLRSIRITGKQSHLESLEQHSNMAAPRWLLGLFEAGVNLLLLLSSFSHR